MILGLGFLFRGYFMRYEIRKYKNDSIGYETIFTTSSRELLFSGYHMQLRKGFNRRDLYMYDNVKKELVHLWV